MLNDPLASALSKILNRERVGKKDCLITTESKELKTMLKILNTNGYIGTFDEVSPAKGGIIKVHLLNNINECKVIKPRFSVKANNFEKFEKRFLPAKNMGVLIITTPKGVLTHIEAKKQNTGGKLLAYCY